MPPSKNPVARKRQLANLKPDAATKHGAYAEEKVAPLREQFAAELATQYGKIATPDELELAADRRARVKVISDWLDQRGLLADRRSGRPRAVVQLADRLQSAYERQLAEFRRRGGGHVDEGDTSAWLELSTDEQLGLMSSSPRMREEVAHRILERIADEHHEAHLRSKGEDEASIRDAMKHRADQSERHRVDRRSRMGFLRELSDEDLGTLEGIVVQSDGARQT
jgi:hypothetical protein